MKGIKKVIVMKEKESESGFLFFRLLDESNNPIERSLVRVFHNGADRTVDNEIGSGHTDADGEVFIENIPIADIAVDFAHENYQKQTLSIHKLDFEEKSIPDKFQ